MSLVELGVEFFNEFTEASTLETIPSRWVIMVSPAFEVSSLDFLEEYSFRVESVTDFKVKDDVLLFLVDETQIEEVKIIRDHPIQFGMTLSVMIDVPDSPSQEQLLNTLGHTSAESFKTLLNKLTEQSEMDKFHKDELVSSSLTGREFQQRTNDKGEVKHLNHNPVTTPTNVEPYNPNAVKDDDDENGIE